ncbi:zinc ribbon domain-containing protein [bacterium]|nr:zinc ribbon domain-containing protein [bacterium]
MEEDDDSLGYFQALGQMSMVQCPACGESTSGYSEFCENCGESLGLDPDVAPLDLLAGGEGRRQGAFRKIAVSESKNLIKLKNARDGLAAGTISVDDFLGVVDEVLQFVNSALELYESAYMKHQLGKMPAEAAKIYAEMSLAAKEMQAGLQRMASYAQSADLAEVDAGIRDVEGGLWRVDAAQDVAAQKGEEAAAAAE